MSRISALDNGNILGSIPVVMNEPSEITEYTNLLHLNLQYNPSSFAVIPVYTKGCFEYR